MSERLQYLVGVLYYAEFIFSYYEQSRLPLLVSQVVLIVGGIYWEGVRFH